MHRSGPNLRKTEQQSDHSSSPTKKILSNFPFLNPPQFTLPNPPNQFQLVITTQML
ncbi:hypothetical protein HMPREF9104_02373 [Lentilactobacillus kisonensis F0435]|uniref:Uncharacterized protein n=1 Tax=Lentilactobacillus kisonensis F0435 TaxID=797516 RepID=H1LID2_9LACO|nr:hypothetical protein HMPREF9104_02373 [Lentilactobacillus kisonensis F0435]